MDSQAWQEIFYDPEQSCQLESGQDNASRSRKLFYRMMWTYNAEPKVITQYWRKAFVSNVNDYARVTFDIKLRCQAEKGFNLKPDQAQMVSYDHPESFRYTGGNVILELKCYTAAVPLWMIDLIQTFDLSRSSFSKYRFGMTDLSRMWKYHQAARQSIFE